MRTSLQALSDVEVQVDVELPPSEVDAELARQLSKVRRSARLKGFRPGKAPVEMVRRLYTQQISVDATRELIGGSLEAVIEGVGRQTLGEPGIEPGIALAGEPLKYKVKLQVKPEIKLASLADIEVKVVRPAPESDVVQQRIEALRARHTERVPVEDRGADTGDILVVRTTGTIDGEPDERLTTENMDVRLGADTMIPGFADQLIGARAGERRTVDVTFPEDYPEQTLAGKPALFAVEVTGHVVEELPAVDDEFAQDLGHESVAELTASIERQVADQARETHEREVERRVVAVLLDRNKFSAPPAMVQSQLQNSASRMASLFMMQGINRDQAVEIVRGNVDGLSHASEHAVRRFLLLEAVAKQENIEVDDDAVQAEVVRLIGDKGESAAKAYASEEAREELRVELRERAALELVRAGAVVTLIDAPEPESADAAEAAEPPPSEEPAPEAAAAPDAGDGVEAAGSDAAEDEVGP